MMYAKTRTKEQCKKSTGGDYINMQERLERDSVGVKHYTHTIIMWAYSWEKQLNNSWHTLP